MSIFGFGKPEPTLKERSKEWTKGLTKEMRTLDREMQKMEREEAKIKLDVKKLAQKQQLKACTTLAKSLVKSRLTRERMLTAKTQINSVLLNIKSQVATVTVAKAMQKSNQIMAGMQRLLKVPEIAKIAQTMSAEMMKAGIIDEMVQDAMESVDSEDIDKEADAQVDAALYEITAGELGKLPELTPKQRQQQEEAQAIAAAAGGDAKKAAPKKVLVAGGAAGAGAAARPAAAKATEAKAKPAAAAPAAAPAAAAKPAAAAPAAAPAAAAAPAEADGDADGDDDAAAGPVDPKAKEAQMAKELDELEEMKKRLANL